MTYWQTVESSGGMGGRYVWVLFCAIVLAFALGAVAPGARAKLRLSVLLILASFGTMLISAAILYHGTLDSTAAGYRYVHFGSQLFLAVAIVNLVGVLLFRVVLVPVGLSPAPILRDTLLGVAYIIVALTLLGRHGVDISGIVATSAVVTAVIGFSLQDTLGNVMGGVALQMEQSIAVGDWIRLGEVEGLVREIRWRHTSIETRNWDTIVIPNSVLMKSQVTVLGRREGKPKLHRVWVEFNVDFRHTPAEVIDVVERALQGDPIPNVAADPLPNCILREFKESYGKYAVRYWLIDFASDDPTSSEVRTRIFVALQRAGLSLSVPAQSVFLTLEGRTRDERKQKEELQRRVMAMKGVKIFAPLNDEEREELAKRLSVAPFRRGEIISRQGNEAHYLYVITKGEAEIHVAGPDGQEKHVANIKAGDVFGEMGMMVGARRSASITATTDVVCYRLDKEGFTDTLRKRPEIAEAMSVLLAERKLGLDAILAGLNADALQHHVANTQGDLLQKIRKFFTLQ